MNFARRCPRSKSWKRCRERRITVSPPAASTRRAMLLGYNTTGSEPHRLEDAVEILAELGYGGVALTLDVHHLDPFGPDLAVRTAALSRQLSAHGMRCAIETGARFLLDPRRKHQPT